MEKKLQCHGLQAKNARKFFQPLITISHEENWLFYGHIIYERSIVANFFFASWRVSIKRDTSDVDWLLFSEKTARRLEPVTENFWWEQQLMLL